MNEEKIKEDNYVDFLLEDPDLRYYMMPDDVLHDTRLTLEACNLYMLLYRRCQLSAYGFRKSEYSYDFEFWDNEKQTVFCIYQMDELEIKLRKKRNYISKCVKELKQFGYLEVEINRNKSNANKYFLLKGNKESSIDGNQ